MPEVQPPPTTLRLATASDLAIVRTIVDDAYGHYVARIGRKPGPMLDDHAAFIAAGAVHLLETVEDVVGLIVLVPEPDALLIENVAVRPSAKGRGYGRRLLQFAERFAADAGLPTIRLYTHEKMVENIALYGRNGFVETRRAEEGGLKRVFMEKPVP